MSTRGVLGFVLDGQEKIAYNHSDSYPDGLGVDVLKWLKGSDLQKVVEQVRALRLVSDDTPPTNEDVDRLRSLISLSVSGGTTEEWYCLLRRTQGDPQAILDCGYMENGRAFSFDSLFCEWGYIVDLDKAMFQVYRGFQRQPHDLDRFAHGNAKGGGYPIRLVQEWSLERLPEEHEFIADIEDS